MLCGHEHAASIKEESRSPPLEMRIPLFSLRESPSKNRENLLPHPIGIALRYFLGHFSRFVANFFRGVHELIAYSFRVIHRLLGRILRLVDKARNIFARLVGQRLALFASACNDAWGLLLSGINHFVGRSFHIAR